MPLTLSEIKTFCEIPNMKKNMDDLVKKGYLVKRHPVDLFKDSNGNNIKLPREDLPKGYDLVTGKLSFEISNILDPKTYTPTLTATDASKLAVIDGKSLRKLTAREMARLFGFNDQFILPNSKLNYYDLFGNSIAVNVVKSVSLNLIRYNFLREKFDGEVQTNPENIQMELPYRS